MKPGGGKTKGGSFERLVCQKLSLWVSNLKRDDIFWRSAMSGGRATVKAKKGINNISQLGDISAIDKSGEYLTGRYVLECKSYKSLCLESLIYGTPHKGSIIEYLDVLEKICIGAKKSPILIAKQNAKPVLFITDKHLDLYCKCLITKDFWNFYMFEDVLKIPFETFHLLTGGGKCESY